MFIKFLFAVCCFIPQTDKTDSQLQVNLVGGEQSVGTSTDEIKLNTDYGYSVVEADQVRSIKKSGDEFTIKTAGGVSLTGQIENESLTLQSANGETKIPFSKIHSLAVFARAPATPGKITDGVAANEMTYHLRVPKDYKADNKYNAIIILHGSNMNSRAYVNTIVGRWPELAEKYILIGINGENESRNFDPESPSYNYTYVNFVGKSKYKGYPGTDRESPALVSEVITELKSYLPITKLFVGGHSQGGFLTYSVMMNYPDQVDGAFPISSGMIFQTDPTAYDDEEIRTLQRQNPLAIVHATNDSVVDFGMSESAHQAFLGDRFPMLKLVKSNIAGHAFAALPVDDAITWLEKMTTDEPTTLVEFAQELFEEEQNRDLLGLLNRDDLPELDESQSKTIEDLKAKVEARAAAKSEGLLDRLLADEGNQWVSEFHDFRGEFEFSKASAPVIEAYQKISSLHQEPGTKLFNEARVLFQQENDDAAYARLEVIVDKYYASSKFQTAKRWLDENEKEREKANSGK